MNTEQAHAMKPGDMVTPLSLWNKTERFRKLAPTTEVLAVREQRCETGVMLKVRTKDGEDLWLSAGWFEPANALLNGSLEAQP